MRETDVGAAVVAEPVVAAAMIGADILGVITSGMYSDPMAVYREYIQNSADAVESAAMRGSGRVDIALEVEARRVRIRDNGPGLTLGDAERALVPVGKSRKRGRRLRGFRGIGRLVGLAFGDSVTFLTRAGRDAPVVQVVWDGQVLRSGLMAGRSLEEVMDDCVRVETAEAEDSGECFFEVRVDGVSRYAAASLMNRAAVREYIGEVCPVPFSAAFPYASEVATLFGEAERPLTLDVRLDGEEEAIERPHSGRLTAGQEEDVVELEEVRIPGLGDGREVAAVGWIAHTAYPGAIPKSRGVRCLRARMGNIQVGGESAFDHLFAEDRFNRWCIAELHVLEPSIVPNARRDYFEPGPHLRNLENHLAAVCRRLERRCRGASRERNQERRYRRFVGSVRASLELTTKGYLPADVVGRVVARKLAEIAGWSRKFMTVDRGQECADELQQLAEQLRGSVGHSETLAGVDDAEVRIYRKVFGIVAERAEDPAEATRTIESILVGVGAKAEAGTGAAVTKDR